jgi:hypothetical protein
MDLELGLRDITAGGTVAFGRRTCPVELDLELELRDK